MITDYMLLKAFGGTERPLIMSTGMSTMGEVQHTVKQLGQGNLALLHCNSQYPCPTAAPELERHHHLPRNISMSHRLLRS